jgi:thioredoxin reductase (NADPH)
MRDQIEALKPEFGFELAVLDVDIDAELEARFNELVPVLMHGELELARYRLEAEALRAYLAKIR